VAVIFTPYLGVKLLPAIKPVTGGRQEIYATPRYRVLRDAIAQAIDHKALVALAVAGLFVVAALGMPFLTRQFFPSSDRPEVLVEVQMPEGSSIEATTAAAEKVEAFVRTQPEAKIVTTYIGAGAPRFFFSYNPELPDPAFAKLVVLTANPEARDALKLRLRQRIAQGLAPEARVRVTQLFFGPFPRYLVNFRVAGPDPTVLRKVADKVADVVRANPHTRMINLDWGERAPSAHFVLDQARLRLIGLDPADAAQQIQFLLTGAPITQVREDIRTVDVIARSAGPDRLDPGKLGDLTLTSHDGRLVPLSQLGKIEIRPEDPILRRRDRVPTITVQADFDERLQPPDVSAEVGKALAPLMARLPPGYSIELGGNIEDSTKANVALLPVMPIMVALILLVLVVQTRSLSATAMVFLTAPLGLVGAVPLLLITGKPFGFNVILGLIGLSGILMRNTLILIGQIHTNEAAGLSPYQAVIEATVQRARPVILTALTAVLAFIPLTTSVFWGAMATTLIGGTSVGTVLTLIFLPALYALWFKIGRPSAAAQTLKPVAAEALAAAGGG
jgi:multidrug efflux pump subunit AcrB